MGARSKHEMRVARVEAEGDAPAGLLQRDALGPGLPVPDERPLVQAQAVPWCGLLTSRVAQICLWCTHVVPVGLRLSADPFDGDKLALDTKQLLDHALRLLVAPLAELLVADDAVLVDEVERRPVVVGEGAPDRIVVVLRNRVVDVPDLHRLPHPLDVVLERELRRVNSDDEQPVVLVGPRPRTHVRLLAEPVDARQRPEVHQHHMAAQLGGAEWL
jgi:hypothetical protein